MQTIESSYEEKTNRFRRIARSWSVVIIILGTFVIIMEFLEAWMNPDLIGTYPWYENLIPITLFLAVIGLALAWRWEVFGSVLCIICIVANYVMYIAFGGSGRGLFVVPLILLPVLIPGILFLISWLRTQSISNQGIA
jgi:hypothetical protein